MSGPQFIPFYIGDYLRDTAHLTTEQHGAYLLLIFAAWQHGGRLPNSDAELAAIARLPLDQWRRIRRKLSFFFEISVKFWVQKRVRVELERAQHLHEVRSKAGSKGGSKTKARARAIHPHPQLQEGSPVPFDPSDLSSLRSDSSDLKFFSQFYEIYPRHEDRRSAQKAWTAACKRASPEDIIAGAQRYAEQRSGQDKKFTKLPATWLNADAWANEEVVGHVSRQASPEEHEAARLEALREAGIRVTH